MDRGKYILRIIKNNPELRKEKIIVDLLLYIESIIPEDCRENFYNNLKTLKIDFDKTDTRERTEDFEKIKLNASYYFVDNKIVILNSYYLDTLNMAVNVNNPMAFYLLKLSRVILHELFHTSSTEYDPVTMITKIGFNTFPSNNPKDCNRGLNEGLTDVLTMNYNENYVDNLSGYYLEVQIVRQLMSLIGYKVLIESYFKCEGIKNIVDSLLTIFGSEDDAYEMFELIEKNFVHRHENIYQNTLANIQTKMVKYFIAKMEKAIQSNMHPNEILSMINDFEHILITEEKIADYSPDNHYLDIDKSLILFYEFKEEFILSSKLRTIA